MMVVWPAGGARTWRTVASRLRVWGPRLIVVVSVVWTVAGWSGAFSTMKERVPEAIVLVVIFSASEIVYVAGALAIAGGLSQEILRDAGWRPSGLARAVMNARREYRSTLERVKVNPAVVRGFYANWIAAVTTGVAGLIGVIVLLPPSGWGLLVFPVMDIFASFAWRLAIRDRIRLVSV